jgi:hypothetical protein
MISKCVDKNYSPGHRKYFVVIQNDSLQASQAESARFSHLNERSVNIQVGEPFLLVLNVDPIFVILIQRQPSRSSLREALL